MQNKHGLIFLFQERMIPMAKPKLTKEVTEISGVKMSPVSTWSCEASANTSAALSTAVSEIPENVSAGSTAEILTPDGLVVMRKHSSGIWIKL